MKDLQIISQGVSLEIGSYPKGDNKRALVISILDYSGLSVIELEQSQAQELRDYLDKIIDELE
jgi:hypothetical protein